MNRLEHIVEVVVGTRWTTNGMDFDLAAIELRNGRVFCHVRSGSEYFLLTLSEAIQSIAVSWVTEPTDPEVGDPIEGRSA